MLKTLLLRFLKVIGVVLIFKFVRYSLRTNISSEGFSHVTNQQMEQIIINMIIASITAALIALIFVLIFTPGNKLIEKIQAPIPFSIITFVVVECTIFLLFPDVLVLFLKALII